MLEFRWPYSSLSSGFDGIETNSRRWTISRLTHNYLTGCSKHQYQLHHSNTVSTFLVNGAMAQLPGERVTTRKVLNVETGLSPYIKDAKTTCPGHNLVFQIRHLQLNEIWKNICLVTSDFWQKLKVNKVSSMCMGFLEVGWLCKCVLVCWVIGM